MIYVLSQDEPSDTEEMTYRYWYQQNTKVRDEVDDQYRDQEKTTLRETICLTSGQQQSKGSWNGDDDDATYHQGPDRSATSG